MIKIKDNSTTAISSQTMIRLPESSPIFIHYSGLAVADYGRTRESLSHIKLFTCHVFEWIYNWRSGKYKNLWFDSSSKIETDICSSYYHWSNNRVSLWFRFLMRFLSPLPHTRRSARDSLMHSKTVNSSQFTFTWRWIHFYGFELEKFTRHYFNFLMVKRQASSLLTDFDFKDVHHSINRTI